MRRSMSARWISSDSASRSARSSIRAISSRRARSSSASPSSTGSSLSGAGVGAAGSHRLGARLAAASSEDSPSCACLHRASSSPPTAGLGCRWTRPPRHVYRCLRGRHPAAPILAPGTPALGVRLLSPGGASHRRSSVTDQISKTRFSAVNFVSSGGLEPPPTIVEGVGSARKCRTRRTSNTQPTRVLLHSMASAGVTESRSIPGVVGLAAVLFAAAVLPGVTAVVPGTAVATTKGEQTKYCPAGDATGFRAKRLAELRLKRAERVAGRHDCTVRVAKRDGEWIPGTSDCNPWPSTWSSSEVGSPGSTASASRRRPRLSS